MAQTNPNGYIGHEAAEARIAANRQRVDAEREAREAELGVSGSDGVILDGVNRVIGQGLQDRIEEPVEDFARGFGEAFGDVGIIAVTGPSALRERRGHGTAGSADSPQQAAGEDTPPLTLRLPRA